MLNPMTGVLSGTPTASGPFNFTIQATGSGGCSGSTGYTMSVSTRSAVCSQSFDSSAPPSLPGGWVSVSSPGIPTWVTSPINPDTPSNAAYARSAATAGTTALITPAYVVMPNEEEMEFRTAFNFEDEGAGSTIGRDGMVLEISINGGAYQDIIAAGGSFVTGGYNKTISSNFGNPLGGRMAWSGLSGGTPAVPAYITTTVNMPVASYGQLVRMRWVVASDVSTIASGDAGARVDTILGTTCAATATGVEVSGRVLTPFGQGLVNATVTITDESGAVGTCRTSSFGYFRFSDIETGRTYIMHVDSRHYTFDTRVIQVFDNLSDIDFVGRE